MSPVQSFVRPVAAAAFKAAVRGRFLGRENSESVRSTAKNFTPAWSVLLLCLAHALSFSSLRADSLWSDKAAPRGMVSDKRALGIGDILSVLVQESSVASKDTSTKTAKSSAIDASVSSFFYSPQASGLLTKKGSLPALKVDSKQNFDGGGQINNSEKIVARLAVTVVDVLPNNNLVIEGKRQTSFAGETQDAILRGIVRPTDITANNTIFSYHIADATIRYVSKGAASNSTRKGWFSKLWEKIGPF